MPPIGTAAAGAGMDPRMHDLRKTYNQEMKALNHFSADDSLAACDWLAEVQLLRNSYLPALGIGYRDDLVIKTSLSGEPKRWFVSNSSRFYSGATFNWDAFQQAFLLRWGRSRDKAWEALMSLVYQAGGDYQTHCDAFTRICKELDCQDHPATMEIFLCSIKSETVLLAIRMQKPTTLDEAINAFRLVMRNSGGTGSASTSSSSAAASNPTGAPETAQLIEEFAKLKVFIAGAVNNMQQPQQPPRGAWQNRPDQQHDKPRWNPNQPRTNGPPQQQYGPGNNAPNQGNGGPPRTQRVAAVDESPPPAETGQALRIQELEAELWHLRQQQQQQQEQGYQPAQVMPARPAANGPAFGVNPDEYRAPPNAATCNPMGQIHSRPPYGESHVYVNRRMPEPLRGYPGPTPDMQAQAPPAPRAQAPPPVGPERAPGISPPPPEVEDTDVATAIARRIMQNKVPITLRELYLLMGPPAQAAVKQQFNATDALSQRLFAGHGHQGPAPMVNQAGQHAQPKVYAVATDPVEPPLLLEGFINGYFAQLTIDTGAQYNVMSKSAMFRFRLKLVADRIPFRGVDGVPRLSEGTCEANVRVGDPGVTVRMDFIVVDDNDDRDSQVLVGLPWLRATHAQLCFKANTISVQRDSSTTLTLPFTRVEMAAAKRVQMVGNWYLPAEETTAALTRRFPCDPSCALMMGDPFTPTLLQQRERRLGSTFTERQQALQAGTLATADLNQHADREASYSLLLLNACNPERSRAYSKRYHNLHVAASQYLIIESDRVYMESLAAHLVQDLCRTAIPVPNLSRPAVAPAPRPGPATDISAPMDQDLQVSEEDDSDQDEGPPGLVEVPTPAVIMRYLRDQINSPPPTNRQPPPPTTTHSTSIVSADPEEAEWEAEYEAEMEQLAAAALDADMEERATLHPARIFTVEPKQPAGGSKPEDTYDELEVGGWPFPARVGRHVPPAVKEQLAIGLEARRAAFAFTLMDLSEPARVPPHRIHLRPDVQPVHVKPRRKPAIQEQLIEKMAAEQEAAGIVQQSESEWCMEALCIPKKVESGIDRSSLPAEALHRAVVDFRPLNERCAADQQPMPTVATVVEEAAKGHLMSKLDIRGAFYQIDLHPDSRPLTAFATKSRLLEYRRMPMGLKTAPATYIRAMETVFRGQEGACSYFDDVLVHSPMDYWRHLQTLWEVLDRMIYHNLRASPHKCVFFSTQVRFTGFVLEAGTIRCDPEKTAAVTTMRPWLGVDALQKFLGFCVYYGGRRLDNLAQLTHPLRQLLKKGAPFVWTEQHQQATDVLKRRIVEDVVLYAPVDGLPYKLATDFSATALGAALCQMDGDEEKPIAFASRATTVHEAKLSATEGELAALLYGIRYFHTYLYGQHFVVETDHSALSFLQKNKDTNSKLGRAAVLLQDYDFVVVYRKGRWMGHVDGLSRMPPLTNQQEEHDLALPPAMNPRPGDRILFVVGSDLASLSEGDEPALLAGGRDAALLAGGPEEALLAGGFKQASPQLSWEEWPALQGGDTPSPPGSPAPLTPLERAAWAHLFPDLAPTATDTNPQDNPFLSVNTVRPRTPSGGGNKLATLAAMPTPIPIPAQRRPRTFSMEEQPLESHPVHLPPPLQFEGGAFGSTSARNQSYDHKVPPSTVSRRVPEHWDDPALEPAWMGERAPSLRPWAQGSAPLSSAALRALPRILMVGSQHTNSRGPAGSQREGEIRPAPAFGSPVTAQYSQRGPAATATPARVPFGVPSGPVARPSSGAGAGGSATRSGQLHPRLAAPWERSAGTAAPSPVNPSSIFTSPWSDSDGDDDGWLPRPRLAGAGAGAGAPPKPITHRSPSPDRSPPPRANHRFSPPAEQNEGDYVMSSDEELLEIRNNTTSRGLAVPHYGPPTKEGDPVPEDQPCAVCHGLQDADQLIVCEDCKQLYHTYCLTDMMSDQHLLAGAYFCKECRPYSIRDSSPAGYRDIWHDNEVLELLRTEGATNDRRADRRRLNYTWDPLTKRLFTRDGRLVPRPKERFELARSTHIALGHRGSRGVADALRVHYCWKDMKKDVKQAVEHCPQCVDKQLVPVVDPVLQSIPPCNLFQKWTIDLMKVPESPKGNKYIAVGVESYSRNVVARGIPNKQASTVKQWVEEDIIYTYGKPAALAMDRGGEFMGPVRTMCKSYGITMLQGSSYHPMSQGLVERANRTLKASLSSFLHGKQPGDWELYLQRAVFGMRAAKQASTRYSPFRLMYGVEATLPLDITGNMALPADPNLPNELPRAKEITNLAGRAAELEKTHGRAMDNLAQAQSRQQRQHAARQSVGNASQLVLGSIVYVQTRQRGKFSGKATGPYKVTSIEGKMVTVAGDNPGTAVRVNVERLFFNGPAGLVPASGKGSAGGSPVQIAAPHGAAHAASPSPGGHSSTPSPPPAKRSARERKAARRPSL